jgi:hypothetical protein
MLSSSGSSLRQMGTSVNILLSGEDHQDILTAQNIAKWTFPKAQCLNVYLRGPSTPSYASPSDQEGRLAIDNNNARLGLLKSILKNMPMLEALKFESDYIWECHTQDDCIFCFSDILFDVWKTCPNLKSLKLLIVFREDFIRESKTLLVSLLQILIPCKIYPC